MQIETKEIVTFIGILVTLALGIYNTVQNYMNSKRTTFINTVTSERVSGSKNCVRAFQHSAD
jgi:hypothetical protein